MMIAAVRGVWIVGCVAMVSVGAAAEPARPAASVTAGPGAVAPSAFARKPLTKQPVEPVRVTLRDDGVFFVDFGRDSFGQLELEVPAPGESEVGNRVVVRLGEMAAGADRLQARPGGSVRFVETGVTLEAGKTRYVAPLPRADARAMPDDVGAVMPFRYVELINMPSGTTAATLKAGAVRQIAVFYPFDDRAAEFACSDERLNAVWDLCKHSIKATSFAGLFVDGDRERKPYEADAYINQLGWYCCTTDVSLPRLTHEYLIAHPTWPTEWIMFSVMMAWEDYRYTGDATSLAANYDDLKAKTLRGLRRADGLISTVRPRVPAAVKEAIHFRGDLRDIVDWPEGERDGYDMRPANTVVNAFHCHAMELMGNVADVLGRRDEAAEFRQAAEKTRESLGAILVEPDSGLFVDGEGSTHSALHANMFPLAFELVPEERRAKVVGFVGGRGMACSVYGAQFLMEALFDQGRGDEALRLMVAPGDRSWRHMVEDVGTTMTLEAWDTRYKPNQDWNHAWGAAPANLLPRKVLGVEPLEAGYRKALIWPRGMGSGDAGGLAWARGNVPTVRGPIEVDWRRSPTGFRLLVELPPGVAGEVRLPDAWGRQVRVDGKSVEGVPGAEYVAVEIAQPGRHELVVGR